MLLRVWRRSADPEPEPAGPAETGDGRCPEHGDVGFRDFGRGLAAELGHDLVGVQFLGAALVEAIKPFALDADIVPPQATIHGFLFFDLNHDMSLAADASLYVPDVTTVPSNKALMFFEVSLGK